MAELKNSSHIGLEAERKVREDLKKRNCDLLGERIKTPFAEVDILFRSSRGQVVLLEVKSLSRWDWLESRLSHNQQARLKRAASYFEIKMKESVQICVAFVIQNKIVYLEI